MTDGGQGGLAQELAGPAALGARGAVERLETHISHVLLVGDDAYKLKKPLNMGFLDFSTLAARRRACLDELSLNRRLAPEVYLEVLAVRRGPGGALSLVPADEAGDEAVDYLVHMRRMRQDRLMDGLLEKGQVDEADVLAIADILAEFYAHAARGPQIDHYGRPEQVLANVQENFTQTEAYQEVTAAPGRWQAIRDYSLGFMDDHWGLFEARVAQGRIRDGHGDLHSGNINLPVGGRPIIFDCIEFNERFRYQDAAGDLAFLAMDLDYHQRPDLARLLVERYVAASGDDGLTAVLDFYKCYRAVVRAKVYGLMVDDQGMGFHRRQVDLDKARAHFRLAARYAGGGPPYFLVCVMGLMGAGKSYLARQLAQATGWLRLSSDEMRKRLAGLDPAERRYEAWGQGLYGPEATAATYDALLEGAQSLLDEGESVIVDASFASQAQRRRFVEAARDAGAQALLVEVDAPAEVVDQRLARREAKGGSASDGRREIAQKQRDAWQGPGDMAGQGWFRVVSGVEEGRPLRQVLERLAAMGWRKG